MTLLVLNFDITHSLTVFVCAHLGRVSVKVVQRIVTFQIFNLAPFSFRFSLTKDDRSKSFQPISSQKVSRKLVYTPRHAEYLSKLVKNCEFSNFEFFLNCFALLIYLLFILFFFFDVCPLTW